MVRPTNGFGDLSDPALANKASQIHTAMDGNSNFPTPDPDLTVFQQAIDAFDAELEKGEGSSAEAALKNEKRDDLLDVLHRLSRYVDYKANGNRAIILSSGFDATKISSSRPPVSAVTNLQARDGASAGEVALSFDRDPSAVSYIYQWTQDPLSANSVWQSQGGTTRKTVISNLESGKAYWFRVIAIGKNGQQAICDPIKRIVQ